MKNLKLTFIFALATVWCVQSARSQSSFADHILGGMTCVIVQHHVTDFDTWYVAYKKDEKRRKKAGIKEKLLLRGVEDASFITVILELTDVKKAKKFFADPQTAQLMQSAGVTDKPAFTYFKVNNSGIPGGGAFLMARHTVKDYTSWKQAFDNHQKVRADYHLSLTALGQELEDSQHVVVILNNTDTDNIKAFLEKSDLKEAMEKAGVSGPTLDIMARYTK